MYEVKQKSTNNYLISPLTNFVHFGAWNNIIKSEFQIFFILIFIWSKMKGFFLQMFWKIFYCKVPANFWKWKICRTASVRGQIRRFFGIGLTKTYLIGRKVSLFENGNKMKIHPTLDQFGYSETYCWSVCNSNIYTIQYCWSIWPQCHIL